MSGTYDDGWADGYNAAKLEVLELAALYAETDAPA